MAGALTAGLDIARVRDDSAFAVLEAWRTKQVLIHLAAWKPTREDCADVLLPVVDWLDRNQGPAEAHVAIDGRKRTGEAVVDGAVSGALGQRADVYALLPSHSDAPHLQRPDGWIYVGKDPLVRGLRDGLERGDLLVAPDLPLADAFRRELGRMVRIPTRRAMGTTWSHPDQRKGSHDDMTMAAAYAYWLAYTITAHGQAVRPLCRAHGGTE